jgi:hypothetical protein
VNWYAVPAAQLICAQHIEGAGRRLFAEICSRDLEGVVVKRRLGVCKEAAAG